jgi:hypothetical protein
VLMVALELLELIPMVGQRRRGVTIRCPFSRRSPAYIRNARE